MYIKSHRLLSFYHIREMSNKHIGEVFWMWSITCSLDFSPPELQFVLRDHKNGERKKTVEITSSIATKISEQSRKMFHDVYEVDRGGCSATIKFLDELGVTVPVWFREFIEKHDTK